MKYQVTQSITTAEGTANAISIHEGDGKVPDSAKMEFHQILASAYANPAVTEATVTIMDVYGRQYNKEYILR